MLGKASILSHTSHKCFTHLNIATLFTRTPSWKVNESLVALDRRSVRGKSGTRIVFSWTWNENKKNDIAEPSKA